MLSMASSSEIDDLDPHGERQIFGVPILVRGVLHGEAWDAGRLDDGERPLVGVQLDTLVGERLRRGRQEPFGHVAVDQQLFGGVGIRRRAASSR